MGKASEIWKEIKPKIGEMLVAVNDIETRAEKAQEEAYQRGYCDALEKHCEICEEKHDAEESYQQGLNNAWECARKIIYMPEDDLLNIFTECYSTVSIVLQVILKYDASEAIEKLKAYEQEQETDGLWQNIQTIVDKCGYTLDEIAAVLEKMREE